MSLAPLRALAGEILLRTEQILRAGAPPIDWQHLADLRRQVAHAQTRFFAEQERLVLRPLRDSGDEALAAIARECVARDLEGRQLGLAHYQAWPLARIAEDPAGYRASVARILRWMEARVLHAEQIVYPAHGRLISSRQRTPAG